MISSPTLISDAHGVARRQEFTRKGYSENRRWIIDGYGS